MPGGSTCLIWPSFCLVTCLQLESNQNPFTHQANALTVLVYSMKGYLLLPYLCLNIISEYCTFCCFLSRVGYFATKIQCCLLS